jgi:hypothetical protein
LIKHNDPNNGIWRVLHALATDDNSTERDELDDLHAYAEH